jgi:hypothetical protein
MAKKIELTVKKPSLKFAQKTPKISLSVKSPTIKIALR